MTVSGECVEDIRVRLERDGCEIQRLDWSGQRVLCGRRSEFRFRWMATSLHLFVLVSEVSRVTSQAIIGFTDTALDFAQHVKGGLPVGFQTGIAVFPTLVSAQADPDAATWASSKQRQRFACIARPVVVDTSNRTTACYRGTPALGLVYASYLRRKSEAYLPYLEDQRR